MVKEAEAHAEEDRKRREAVELRNEADNLVFRTEKLLSENGDKITDDVKQPVEEALAELKTALEGEDNDAVKAAVDKVNTTSAAVGQAMYAAAQAASASEAASAERRDHRWHDDSSAGSDDDVVDAEIVDDDQNTGDQVTDRPTARPNEHRTHRPGQASDRSGHLPGPGAAVRCGPRAAGGPIDPVAAYARCRSTPRRSPS